MKSMNDDSIGDAVRIFDIIPEESMQPSMDSSFPLYEILAGGVLRENPGIKRRDMTLVYDVTGASEEFKETYKDLIHKLEVKKVIKIQGSSTPSVERAGKIVSILPLSANSYVSLTREEQKPLGFDYVSVEITKDGIRIKPVIRIRGDMPNDLYLRLPSAVDPEALEKVENDVVELVSKENGLFEQNNMGDLTQEKKF